MLTTDIYTLSLHDALPICAHTIKSTWKKAAMSGGIASWNTSMTIVHRQRSIANIRFTSFTPAVRPGSRKESSTPPVEDRSEEHTSELQSRGHLVCRLLLEK